MGGTRRAVPLYCRQSGVDRVRPRDGREGGATWRRVHAHDPYRRPWAAPFRHGRRGGAQHLGAVGAAPSGRPAGGHDRLADRISGFTGSLRFVYCHLAIYGLWIVPNLPGVPLPHFDPTYVVLAMAASVEAIFLSTFILITQNRMAAQAERSAELDLQVSLLAELAQDVAPEKVLDTMDAHQQQLGEDGRRAQER
jgi:hypothetical protein